MSPWIEGGSVRGEISAWRPRLPCHMVNDMLSQPRPRSQRASPLHPRGFHVHLLIRHCRSHDGMYLLFASVAAKNSMHEKPPHFRPPESSKVIDPLNWRSVTRRKTVAPRIVDELDGYNGGAENKTYIRGFRSPDRRVGVRLSVTC